MASVSESTERSQQYARKVQNSPVRIHPLAALLPVLAHGNSENGKKRKDAMKEYVDLLTSISPQWRIAHMIGAKDSLKSKEAKVM